MEIIAIGDAPTALGPHIPQRISPLDAEKNRVRLRWYLYSPQPEKDACNGIGFFINGDELHSLRYSASVSQLGYCGIVGSIPTVSEIDPFLTRHILKAPICQCGRFAAFTLYSLTEYKCRSCCDRYTWLRFYKQDKSGLVPPDNFPRTN